jgi:endonuclease YncB( thermonuclease family)
MTRIFHSLMTGTAILLIAVPAASAHPGRTDGSGCHTCRTNCSRWGLRNGQYHCHGGSQRRSGVSRIPPPPPSPPPPPPEPVRIRRSDQLPTADAPLPESSIVLHRSLKRTAGVSVEVLAVVDGDTFVARQGGRLYLMTLRDVEAPELEQPDGPAARDRLASRIVGRRLVVWPEKPEGCLVPVLAEMEGADVAELQLAEGFAWAAASASASWQRLQTDARNARMGLWVGMQPEPPWEFRARR